MWLLIRYALNPVPTDNLEHLTEAQDEGNPDLPNAVALRRQRGKANVRSEQERGLPFHRVVGRRDLRSTGLSNSMESRAPPGEQASPVSDRPTVY